MPIVQDRDVKFPYKRYRYYFQAFWLKAIVSQWYSRSFGVENETAQIRILACLSYFYYYFCVCVCMWKGSGRFVHFLHIVANSHSAFPK